ncbi:MAG TPA: Ig-like domain-containing protein [Ignavibacteria bacterium]
MKIIFRIFMILISFFSTLVIFSCANQLPPSGGEDDKTPPKLLAIYPKSGSVNVTEKNITIEFDEYVDRRSFEESFYISPKPKGNQEFSWSGKKVTIEYENGFEKDKTYNVTIGTGLKDIRAGNKSANPIQIAFSTGDKIDNYRIKGKIFSKNFSNVIIFAYNLDTKLTVNPEKETPDYFAQSNSDGTYFLNNISKGKYRIFAVKDNDRNFLYDKNFDEIAMTDRDIDVRDTIEYYYADFLMTNLEFNALDPKFLDTFSSDSLKMIYTSVKDGTVSLPVNYKFYFLFKISDLSRFEIADNIFFQDTLHKRNLKLIYNWLTDSLLEVIPLEGLNYATVYKLSIDLSNTAKKYYYKIQFLTAEEKKFSKISGIVSGINETGIPVVVNLIDEADLLNRYSINMKSDSIFVFSKVPAGDYYLFAYLDRNNDNIFQKGNYDTFVPSEKFYLSDKVFNIRGKMDYEKILINFEK